MSVNDVEVLSAVVFLILSFKPELCGSYAEPEIQPRFWETMGDHAVNRYFS